MHPTDKELFYLRGKISPTMIEKISLGVKLHNNKKKSGSAIKRKSRKQKFKFPGKILICKTRLKFWGVTTLPPLRKNLVLEIC